MQFILRSKRRTIAGGAFIVAVAGTAAAFNPAASAGVLSVIQSTVTCATTTACVAGANTKAGPGVSATSKTGTAIIANGVAGLSAIGTTGDAVHGISVSGHGVWGSSSGGSGIGVEGLNTGPGTGVLGHTSSGLALYGLASSGNAVEAISQTGFGVVGSTGGSGTAIYAQSDKGYGLRAVSNGQPSVYGVNANGDGSEFQGTYIGVIGIAPASGGFPFVAYDQKSNAVFQVTGTGDVDFTGSIHSLTRVSGGALVKSYAPVSSTPTVEDTGTAQLVAGAAVVRLDATYAALIDKTTRYRVFLTPDGDTRGLYISARTPSSFVVRETQGGRSTLTFDYRIIAASLGQANQRAAVVNASALARAPLTPATKLPRLGTPLSSVAQ